MSSRQREGGRSGKDTVQPAGPGHLDKIPNSVLQFPLCPLLLSLLGDGKTVLVAANWQQFRQWEGSLLGGDPTVPHEVWVSCQV